MRIRFSLRSCLLLVLMVAAYAFGAQFSESNRAVDMVFAFTGKLYDENVKLQNNLRTLVRRSHWAVDE